MKQYIKDNKLITELELDRHEWYLADIKGVEYIVPKIDRSYRGKQPDVGIEYVIINNDNLIEELKRKLDFIER